VLVASKLPKKWQNSQRSLPSSHERRWRADRRPLAELELNKLLAMLSVDCTEVTELHDGDLAPGAICCIFCCILIRCRLRTGTSNSSEELPRKARIASSATGFNAGDGSCSSLSTAVPGDGGQPCGVDDCAGLFGDVDGLCKQGQLAEVTLMVSEHSLPSIEPFRADISLLPPRLDFVSAPHDLRKKKMTMSVRV